MTLDAAKVKLKELNITNFLIKDKGFWNDNTQLIFFSDVDSSKHVNRAKRNFFLVDSTIYELPSPLKQMMLNHIDHGVPVEAHDIIQGEQRWKVPIKYFNKLWTPEETKYPQIEELKDNSITTNITSQPCANQLLDSFNDFVKNPSQNLSKFLVDVVNYSSK